MAAPASLAWSATTNGFNQLLVDSTDTTYTVIDPTGSGAGWTVTAAATQFTGTGASPPTLPDGTSGGPYTFVTTGSTSSETATSAPSNGCATGSTCTVPTNDLAYPVGIVTDGSATNIYDAAASTGLGAILIGGSTAVGWWVNVPSNAVPSTYTSTITLAITSGPPAG